MTKVKKILIIDDELSLLKALKVKLSSKNHFEIKSTSNGNTALKILRKENFDLIILDLVMPKLDGFSVLTELQRRKNKSPIMVLSNLDQDGIIKGSKKALGVKDYIVKSDSSLEEVFKHVKKIIGS
jgi:DNA-binding response OmpR family regulator